MKDSTKNSTRSKLTLRAVLSNAKKRKAKTLASFYGKLPKTYGDGVAFQKAVRNEWQ
jgi:hypothetical protein